MLISLLTLVISVTLAIAVRRGFLRQWYRLTHSNGTRALPPGPRGWPIIGNLLDFPTEYMWLEFRKWSLTYGTVLLSGCIVFTYIMLNVSSGDLTFLQLLNTRMLVVSSAQAALDLMEKRSSIYSDKPAMPIDEL